jgi:dual specificity MAP kinase phosphatase
LPNSVCQSNYARQPLTSAVLSERTEMAAMTVASEIAPNVFLGPSPDPGIPCSLNGSPVNRTNSDDYDVLVEASEMGPLPSAKKMQELKLALRALPAHSGKFGHLEVPGSGTIQDPKWNQVYVDGLIELVKWLWEVSTGQDLKNTKAEDEELADGITITTSSGHRDWVSFDAVHTQTGDWADEMKEWDSTHDTVLFDDQFDDEAKTQRLRQKRNKNTIEQAVKDKSTSVEVSPKKILLHCLDGYTETSLLALAYSMFAHGLTVGEAWVSMHVNKERNFFAYPSDVSLLRAIQPRILSISPAFLTKKAQRLQPRAKDGDVEMTDVDLDPMNILSVKPDPVWLNDSYDGSLPSRVLPYLYLGNIAHAKSPALLKELGIKRILSVGENIDWKEWKSKLDPPAMCTGEDGSELHRSMSKTEVREFSKEGYDFLKVGGCGLADNGIDGLSMTFDKCMEFIGKPNRF